MSGKTRIRPYLHTQMPVYGKAVATIGPALAKADARANKELPTGDSKAGQKLTGTLGGLGCITCHRWGERPSLGIQALDLSTLSKRINGPWLREYLIDPAAYRPGTLMPSFWPAGKAANTTVLNGDTDAQIAAILAFASGGKGLPEGYPATQAGEFELIPKDRPIIQRTFMEGVGTRAILVGFPAGIHIAYDAEHCAPALVWKGKFFDAYNTWFTRAAPFEKPLGEVIGRWTSSTEARAFKGYKLDAAGVPTFLSEAGEDRFEPKDGALHRWVTGTQSPTHPDGVTVTEVEKGHYIYSWK
jgi:hypothetical protein